jgi:hypothetical protein
LPERSALLCDVTTVSLFVRTAVIPLERVSVSDRVPELTDTD